MYLLMAIGKVRVIGLFSGFKITEHLPGMYTNRYLKSIPSSFWTDLTVGLLLFHVDISIFPKFLFAFLIASLSVFHNI